MRREKNKNYLPALILSLAWWGLLVVVVLKVDPEVVADFPLVNTYGVFFILFFLAGWFSFSLLLGNKRRGFWLTIGLVILGYLKIWKILNWYNLTALVGVVGVFIWLGESWAVDKGKVDKLKPV